MFICYKCAMQFTTLDGLIKHFKYSHFVTSSDTLQCKQNDCNQLFSTIKAFKVHLQRVHTSTKINVTPPPNEIETVNINVGNFANQSVILNRNQEKNASIIKPSQTFNLLNSCNELKEKALRFSLRLHAEDNITRSDVLTIQREVTVLCSSIAHILDSSVKSMMPNEISQDVTAILEICKNPFSEISSEHRFFKNLKALDLYQDPHHHEMGNYVTAGAVKGNPTLVGKSFSAYFMPLRFQLKKFFECPGILSSTIKNTQALLSQNKISNFINGESYAKKMKLFDGKTVIPIFLYFDDYGINNPLGSHATSILAGYYSFPTVPQYLLSQVKFIFNIAFIKSNDHKQFGNEVSFHHIIEELTVLEKEGILLVTPELTVKVYFVLGAVLGDNLGLNCIMGFTKSFNSNSFCRACKRTKLQTKKDCTEVGEFLRNETNYNLDLQKNDLGETGLRENCTFNRIPSFDVLDNFVFDLMHDVFEGVCHYDVCNILISLIQENIISVDTLNSRKNLFQYGETEVGYISTAFIDECRLKSYKLKMSARESWTFIHFLPLMLGDLIPKTNRPWKLLCILLQILDKMLLSEYNTTDIALLTSLIKDHNNLYIHLYGDLKPKHHFLVHYPTLIRKCGAPKYLWSFRFEAKHQSSKAYTNNTSSRINIPYTLSIKAGLKYAKFLIDSKHGFGTEYYLESKDFLDTQQIDFSHMNLTPFHKLQLQDANFYQAGTYHGRKYKVNLYLTGVENCDTKLHKIVNLVELPENALHILVNEIEVKCFDYHFQSFEVGQCLNNFNLIPIEKFTSPPLHIYTSNNGKVYLRNKFL